MRECCKVDDASQSENWRTLLRHGYLPTCKILSRSLKGFLFPVCAKLRIKMFTRLLFLGRRGSSNDLQPRRLNRFSRVIRQATRFRARMCLSQCVHCCKGDATSQWEMAILGVSELRNHWTYRLKIWHTWLRRWADLVCQISQGIAGNMVKCTLHVLLYFSEGDYLRAST